MPYILQKNIQMATALPVDTRMKGTSDPSNPVAGVTHVNTSTKAFKVYVAADEPRLVPTLPTTGSSAVSGGEYLRVNEDGDDWEFHSGGTSHDAVTLAEQGTASGGGNLEISGQQLTFTPASVPTGEPADNWTDYALSSTLHDAVTLAEQGTASGGGNLEISGQVLTFTPAAIHDAVTLAEQGTASGGGNLEISGQVLTFTPAAIHDAVTLAEQGTASGGGNLEISGQVLTFTPASTDYYTQSEVDDELALKQPKFHATEPVSTDTPTGGGTLSFNTSTNQFKFAPADVPGGCYSKTQIDDFLASKQQTLSIGTNSTPSGGGAIHFIDTGNDGEKDKLVFTPAAIPTFSTGLDLTNNVVKINPSVEQQAAMSTHPNGRLIWHEDNGKFYYNPPHRTGTELATKQDKFHATPVVTTNPSSSFPNSALSFSNNQFTFRPPYLPTSGSPPTDWYKFVVGQPTTNPLGWNVGRALEVGLGVTSGGNVKVASGKMVQAQFFSGTSVANPTATGNTLENPSIWMNNHYEDNTSTVNLWPHVMSKQSNTWYAHKIMTNSGGTTVAGSNVPTPSDDRLKYNEVAVSNGLSTMRKLVPKTYHMHHTLLTPEDEALLEASGTLPPKTTELRGETVVLAETGTKQSGFIAQEVAKIPELAYAVHDGECLGLDYNSLFTHAVAAIKELDTLVQKQTVQIASLTRRVQALEA